MSRVFHHITDHQRFHNDKPESIDEPGDLLVNKVLPPVLDPLMDTCYHLAPFLPHFCAFFCLGKSALGSCQCVFFSSEEAGILDLVAGRQIGERVQSDVDAHCLLRLRDQLRFHFITRKADAPFAGGTPDDRAGFDDPGNRAMHLHPDGSDFGEGESDPLFGFSIPSARGWAGGLNAKTRLRVGDRVIAKPRFKSRVAWNFSIFHPSEKGLKGLVEAVQDILQHLGIDALVLWAEFFDVGKLRTLRREGDAFATYAISFSAFFQACII